MTDDCFKPGDVIRFKPSRVSALFSWYVVGEWESDNPFARQSLDSIKEGSQINGSDKDTCFTVLATRTVTMEERELVSPNNDGKHEFLLLLRPGALAGHWFRHHSDAFERV